MRISIFTFVMLASLVGMYVYQIDQNNSDGTETDQTIWFEDGLSGGLNYLGTYDSHECDVGLRFETPQLTAGYDIYYARLALSSFGGEITSGASLLIEGVAQANPPAFDPNNRPSQLAKTRSKVYWNIPEAWDVGSEDMPLFYYSPDISSIVNEILSLAGWGRKDRNKSVVITIKNLGTVAEDNYITFDDFSGDPILNSPAKLEIYPTLYSTMLGSEVLCKPTDTTITVHLYALVSLDVYVEWGLTSSSFIHATPVYLNRPAETSIQILVNNLYPDTLHYYRVMYKRPGEAHFNRGPVHSFYTQRQRGKSFVFDIQSDEHVGNAHGLPPFQRDIDLYDVAINNIGQDNPDFIISLGDFAMTESYKRGNIRNIQDGIYRYLLERTRLGNILSSSAFFLTIGNHEGEQAWYLKNGDDLPIMAITARKTLFPNPIPDRLFYVGNLDQMLGVGYREDYYAFEWGDALFVVLDPYHYTEKQPKSTQNGWDWTLGEQQYNWLYTVTTLSTAKWKFVFIHHMTSTIVIPFHPQTCYGRGGIEVVKHKVDNRSTFEWGGENGKGDLIFADERPGWSHGPIHDFLVANGVDIVFHGHDHVFAKQDLDGIVYQECPRPNDSDYSYGFKDNGKYTNGIILTNSGHIKVSVSLTEVQIDYIRAYLPGEGVNGEVAYSYTLY